MSAGFVPRRPWCVRCWSWAEHLGVACDVHWWDLSDETRARIEANVRERHPRGGRVTRVTEQMWVTARSNARAEWKAAETAMAGSGGQDGGGSGMSGRPEPVTTEELVKFRESVRMLGGHDNYALHWSNNTVARLIATLDQAETRRGDCEDALSETEQALGRCEEGHYA